MARIELKKCPFCGGEAKYESSLNVTPQQDENGAYVDYDEMYYWERTYCTECGAEISSESDDEKEEITITKWNTRYLIEYNVKMKDCWIPCRERMPEHYNEILFCERDRTIHKGYMYWDGTFIEHDVKFKKNDIVSWMPMPDAYEPPESEVQHD